MRPPRPLSRWVLATCLLASCAVDGGSTEEDLGDLGDGKADSFGIVERAFTVDAGHSRRFTWSASSGFRVSVTQPATAVADRTELTLLVTSRDGDRVTADAAAEPVLVVDHGGPKFTLTIRNVGARDASGVLDVRPLGGFGALPDPNAPAPPDAAWTPPDPASWPDSYVIFNNTGCGHDCAGADLDALAPRSVMIKMLVAAIDDVRDGGIIRVSNYNISSAATVAPVVDALVRAIQTRHATVKIVMDQAQNTPTSRTTRLAAEGAQVRFLDGLHYKTSGGHPSEGIMHSKMLIVDDQVVFAGSNNFSSTGLVTNEENSVVLRGAANAARIAAFTCDLDTMFDAGVAPGEPQRSDDDRRDAVIALDRCNTADAWFPPSGTLATGSSVTLTEVLRAIRGATRSIYLAPDMLAHPSVVFAITSRAKKAKAAGEPFTVKVVVDGSQEALDNPAFGECLTEQAAPAGLDVSVRYWPGTPAIFQLMHHKFIVIDADDPERAVVFNGSANYSSKALKYSFENVTRYAITTHRALVEAFTTRFHQLFAQAKPRAQAEAEDGLAIRDCVL